MTAKMGKLVMWEVAEHSTFSTTQLILSQFPEIFKKIEAMEEGYGLQASGPVATNCNQFFIGCA